MYMCACNMCTSVEIITEYDSIGQHQNSLALCIMFAFTYNKENNLRPEDILLNTKIPSLLQKPFSIYLSFYFQILIVLFVCNFIREKKNNIQ